MAEKLPPAKRTSTRSNRGTNSFFDDYVVEKTPNKKVTKQAKMVEAAEPVAKVERRGRPKKSTSVASEEIKTEIPEPIVDQQEEDEPARKFAKRGRPRKSPVTKENDAAEEVGDHNENEENIPTTPSILSDATEATSATKVAPTGVQPKIVSPLINDIKETPRYNRGTKRHNDDFVYYGGTQPKKLKEMKSAEPAEKLTASPVVTKPIVKSASTAMKSKVPKIVYPLLSEERQSSRSKTPLVKVGPTPRPTIRFLKPLVHSIGQKPQTSSDSLKMSALKEALFIQRPSTTDFTPLNGPTMEKENVRMPLQIQTNSSSSYKSLTQSPRPQTSTSSSKVSPSIITFANYPNNLLSLEPNVKYCLVNQNGKLMYPASELEESSSELEPSSSPPVYRFFEPCPDYFLTVL
jgi:hypothetical protein